MKNWKPKTKIAMMEAKSKSRIAKAQAKDIASKGRNERLKIKEGGRTSRSKGSTIRSAVGALAAQQTAQTVEEEKTRRRISDNQRETAKAALAKWNGIVNQTPPAAEGTGTGSQGTGSNTTWIGNW